MMPTRMTESKVKVGGELWGHSRDTSTVTCDIPLLHYWYVNQAYKEDIERIEKQSGVKIIPEVKLTFKADQIGGCPNSAFSEFINLVQKCSPESRGFSVPLKKVNPETLKDTLKTIQRQESKLLLTLSSEEMTVCGPRHSQDAIRKSLNPPPETLTNAFPSAGESTWMAQDTLPNITSPRSEPVPGAIAPDMRKLLKLRRKTLNRKDQPATVRVTAASLTLPEKDTKLNDNASMNTPSHLQQVQQQPVEQSGLSPSAAVSTPEEVCSGTIPVSHWWYMNHIYKEDIERIEKENEIKMTAEVNVKFEGDQKDGGPQKALSALIHLAQQCITESQSPNIPLRHVVHQGLVETLKIIQRPENKILLTVSSDGVTVCGPSQSQEAVRKSLNAAQKTTTNAFPSAGESTWMAQNTSPNIGMQIEDPIVNAGLTMEKSSWKMIMSSFDEQVSKIKTKFAVHFEEFDIGQDKVQVKALSKGSGGNKSMESHATRALLQLYQKIVLSPKSFTQNYGATGFSGSQRV